MELDQALEGRRSIRRYLDKDVPKDLVRQVIEAATFAPSAKNGLEKLSKKIGMGNMGSSLSSCSIMEQAPVVVIVWNAGEKGWETEIHSVAAAIQNMLLKAYSLRIGSLWIGDIFYCTEALKRHLGKPWKLTAAVALGWPAETPQPRPRKTIDEVAEFSVG
jgi:nitroreductase